MAEQLIQGCINPKLKERLVGAIDVGCKTDAVNDVMCKEFRQQLNDMHDCAPATAAPAAPKVARAPVKLSAFQKHNSWCLKNLRGAEIPAEVTWPKEKREKPTVFDYCLYEWKSGNHMDGKYRGSEYTKPKGQK